MGKTGEWYHRVLWKTACRWAYLLPLICWQGSEDGNKGVSAEIPEPVAATPRRADSTTLDSSCHSKENWLNHFGLIIKFVLPLEILAMVAIIINRATMPNDPPLLKINDWTMNHVGPMVEEYKRRAVHFGCPSVWKHCRTPQQRLRRSSNPA